MKYCGDTIKSELHHMMRWIPAGSVDAEAAACNFNVRYAG